MKPALFIFLLAISLLYGCESNSEYCFRLCKEYANGREIIKLNFDPDTNKCVCLVKQ